MILRAILKSAEPAPSVTAETIAGLQPFARLQPQMLGTIAEHSRLVERPAGPWKPEADEGDARWYLLRGELAIERDGRLRYRLRAEDPAAAFPLPLAPGDAYRLHEPGRLLQIPARYLNLVQAQRGEDDTAIQLHEDDDEAALYIRFREELAQGQFALPAMPDLAIRIGKALDDPHTVNEDIARLIQLDPALSARVMRVVNSAAFAGGVPAGTLHQAVSRLGRQQVRNLVFSCIIKDLFRTGSPVLRARLDALWEHSRRVAAISALLARFTPGLDADRGLLAGLVHDIGAIPLLHAARDMPELIAAPAVLDRLVTEMKGEIGRMTLRHWRFDDELAELAHQAEHWHRLGSCVPDYLDVVLVAQLHAEVGRGTGTRLPAIDAIPAFRKLALGRLTPRASIAVLEESAREIAEIEELLD